MTATPQDIAAAKETLYSTGGVRDDLDDAEAEILLAWADGQIDRLAHTDGDFGQQNRFLRQLLARIDRLVGQRPYLDEVGHAEHITNLLKMTHLNGFTDVTETQIVDALPADKANARANLEAILQLLTPTAAMPAEPLPATESQPFPTATVPAETSAAPSPTWLETLLARLHTTHDDSPSQGDTP